MTEKHMAEIIDFEHTTFDIGSLDVVIIKLDSGETVKHHFNYHPIDGEYVPKGVRYANSQQLRDVIGQKLSKDIVGERVRVILTNALTNPAVAAFLPKTEECRNETGATDN
jgi:hypothetical protein